MLDYSIADFNHAPHNTANADIDSDKRPTGSPSTESWPWPDAVVPARADDATFRLALRARPRIRAWGERLREHRVAFGSQRSPASTAPYVSTGGPGIPSPESVRSGAAAGFSLSPNPFDAAFRRDMSSGRSGRARPVEVCRCSRTSQRIVRRLFRQHGRALRLLYHDGHPGPVPAGQVRPLRRIAASSYYSWFYYAIYALALFGGILADSTSKYKLVILFGIIIMFAGYASSPYRACRCPSP